jgi:hypothetical protein
MRGMEMRTRKRKGWDSGSRTIGRVETRKDQDLEAKMNQSREMKRSVTVQIRREPWLIIQRLQDGKFTAS